MVKDSIVTRLTYQPNGHSDYIISMHFQLCIHQNATLFSVYAPTLQADASEKDIFHADLCSLLQKVPPNDKIFILSNFNARVVWDF